MPRFENEDFNPNGKQREQEPDRTVPQDENYYNYSPIDFEFNSKKRRSPDDVVTDNQNINSGINPCDSSIQSYNENPQANTQQTFQSETADDFDFSSKRSSSSANNKKSKDRGQAPKRDNKKKAKKHGGKLSLRKKILIIILVLILIIIGAFAVVLARIQYDDKQDNEYVTQSELEDSALVKNILLIGVDARSDDDDETSRSDTMLLISFDMKHRCIKMVSFLRDTWVYIPSMGTEQRLNAACSSGGYNNVVDTIEYNFGVDIDGYVVTDFEMFEVLVDNLGGVEIDVTEEEANEVTNHPSRYGDVVLESGTQTLTGEQALAYCRIRKIDSDFGRTLRQRTVMTAIINGALHSNPFKLYKMAFNAAPYLETDLSKAQLLGLIAQAAVCVTGDIYQTRVPFDDTWSYETIQGNSVISIDTQENKEQLIDYIYNKTAKALAELEEESE